MIEKLKHISVKHIIFIFLIFIFIVLPFYYLNRRLSPDEITFLAIGNFIRNGAVLYRDIIDIKPPGIFYLAALVAGKSFLAAKILSYIVQIASSILVFVLGKKIANKNVGLIASILYLAGVCTPQFFGYSFITEPYSVFFILLSVLFFFKEGYRNKFIAGLALGLAFLFNQTSVLLFGVFFLFYLLRLRYKINRTKEYFTRSLKKLIIILFGTIIPFSIALFYFFLQGVAYEMLYYSVFFISDYNNPLYPIPMTTGFLSYFPVWLLSICMILTVGYQFIKGKIIDNKHLFFILFLLVLSIPTLKIIPDHRTLFIIAPASLLASIFILDLYKSLKRKKNLIQLKCFVTTVLLVITAIAVGTNMYMNFYNIEQYGSIDDQIQSVNEVEMYIEGEIYTFPFNNELFFFSNLTPGIKYLSSIYSKKVAENIINELRMNNISYVVANREAVEKIEGGIEDPSINESQKSVYNYIAAHYEKFITTDRYIIYKIGVNTL